MAKEKVKSGELPAAVKEKYNVIPGVGIGEIAHRGKSYNLTNITLEEADQLVKDGCDILVPKKSISSPEKKS